MTVKELIKKLEKFDGNMIVRFDSTAANCDVAHDIIGVEEVQEDEPDYNMTDKPRS